MIAYSVSTTIEASPETIWKILTDAPNYPAWDPSMDRLDGIIGPGQRITAYTNDQPNSGFPASVTEFVPGQRMTWTGGWPFGLFKMVRTFTLSPNGDGSTAFSLREEFSGPLLRWFAGSLPDQDKVYARFPVRLIIRAERD